MCDICHRTPCHPRCPNSPPPPVVYFCCQCGNGIYEGEEFYAINDERWCEECVNDCRTTAEMDEPDYDREV